VAAPTDNTPDGLSFSGNSNRVVNYRLRFGGGQNISADPDNGRVTSDGRVWVPGYNRSNPDGSHTWVDGYWRAKGTR
jgi:hypothetical protein